MSALSMATVVAIAIGLAMLPGFFVWRWLMPKKTDWLEHRGARPLVTPKPRKPARIK